MFHARLFSEALDHLRDQSAVISHHLVFERGSDQFALGKRAGVRSFHKALKMTDGEDVGRHRAGYNHRRRDAEREANRHAGEAQFHKEGKKSCEMMAQARPAVND